MDFGHIDDPRVLGGIDFRLPDDDPRSLSVLGGKLRANARIHYGLPIWAERSWVGRLYPPGTSPGEHLRAYASQFGAIELNSTHYATPSLETLKRWRESVPSTFRFCPKILQDISHRMGSSDAPRLLDSFVAASSELGETLGPCFLQLPPQFGPDRLPWLKRLLTLCPPSLRLAVEFRHPSWFDEGRLIGPAFEMLASFSAATVICDVAGRRDVSHSSLTAPWVLVRFLGAHGHPSSEARMSDWASRLERWFNQGLEELYFFVHEHQNLMAPELASVFVRQMNAQASTPRLTDWKRWDIPDQLSLL
jgi:uncharacterized protein YecE (DUF72 family)